MVGALSCIIIKKRTAQKWEWCIRLHIRARERQCGWRIKVNLILHMASQGANVAHGETKVFADRILRRKVPFLAVAVVIMQRAASKIWERDRARRSWLWQIRKTNGKSDAVRWA